MKIDVKVVPRSSQVKVVVEQSGLKVYVHESATDGKANDACIRLLARHYGVPKSAVVIVKGERSRQKVITIND